MKSMTRRSLSSNSLASSNNWRLSSRSRWSSRQAGRASTHGFIGNPVEGMTFSRFPRNSGEASDSQTGLSFADSRGVRGEKRANHWPPSNRSSIGRMIDLVIRAKAVRRFLRLGIPTIQALQTADKLMQGRKVYVLRDKDTLKPNLVLTIGRNHIK